MIHFDKYEAAGNDFILTEDPLAASFVSTLCNRTHGIGADGVLLLEPSSIADIKMRIFNADGSEAACCGNGLCSVVTHLKKSLSIETLAGISFGIYFPSHVQISFPKTVLLKELKIGSIIDTGVPHLVIFKDSVEDPNFLTWSRKFRFDEDLLPGGVNVTLASLEKGILRIRTYERGVEGETLACGTGGAAAALAYFDQHKEEKTISVIFPSLQKACYSLDLSGRLWMKGIAKQTIAN